MPDAVGMVLVEYVWHDQTWIFGVRPIVCSMQYDGVVCAVLSQPVVEAGRAPWTRPPLAAAGQ